MTVRASRLPEEESLSLIGITGEFNDISTALQESQITNDLVHLQWLQRGEGGHAGTGDSIANSACQIAVHEVLYFGSGGDVRRVLSAAAIRAVTTGAIGREDCGAGLLRVQPTGRDQSKNDDPDEDALPPTHLRQKTSSLTWANIRLEQELQRNPRDTEIARSGHITESTLARYWRDPKPNDDKEN
jgi:hypothetical protein